jgi:hypothetical protein
MLLLYLNNLREQLRKTKKRDSVFLNYNERREDLTEKRLYKKICLQTKF